MSNHELSVLFFLQLAAILATVRIVGWLARLIGQPQVVGEMIAGVVIGPSFLGAVAPSVSQRLFPDQSIGLIYAVAQIGLVLYMFLIGAEFNVDIIRRRLRSAITVSVAGIVTPFLLGSAVAWLMLRNAALFAPGVKPWEAMLFTGAAMSITAFPMLARIIYERGLSGSTLGTLALAAGSIDDAAAWCLLAIVLASFGQDPSIAVLAIGGGLLYALVVLAGLRPLMRQLTVWASRSGGVNGPLLGFILFLLMLGAWFTDMVGIYAVFGAFVLGVAMPRGIVTRELHRLIEPLATNFLLPLFFVYAGLNTKLGLVVEPALLGITALVVVAAVVGKGVACWAAALYSGETPDDARAVGVLMNARGLMELILLSIGLERGVITPAMFTVMVIMAIVTTLMASPLFEWVQRRNRVAAAQRAG